MRKTEKKLNFPHFSTVRGGWYFRQSSLILNVQDHIKFRCRPKFKKPKFRGFANFNTPNSIRFWVAKTMSYVTGACSDSWQVLVFSQKK